MESPLPFLIVGVIAGSAAAFFLACSHIVTRRMTARAGELLRKGASESAICRQLVAEGYEPGDSARVSAKVMHRARIEIATALLDLGHTQAKTEAKLVGSGIEPGEAFDLMGEADLLRWCRRWRVLVVPAGLALVVAGVIVCGVVLVIGDGPGLLATFLKELVNVFGAGILCLGLVLLMGSFRKSF